MSSHPKVIAIIPARMGSSRFPGKPLENILGKPMIEHVRRRVMLADCVDQVIVATCDDEIRIVVERYGGKVVMTSPHHERATDRIREAADALEDIRPNDIIINVQGDEPLVSEESLEGVIAPFYRNDTVLSTCLVYPIRDRADLIDANVVKTVLSNSLRMLYLSRAGIPGKSYDPKTTYYKQSGIMAYRHHFLKTYTELSPTPLEIKESVDVMRILEHDFWMQGVVSSHETFGVDIPEHVTKIENEIRKNPDLKKIFDRIFSEIT